MAKPCLVLGLVAACGEDAPVQPDGAVEADAPTATCAQDQIPWRFTVRQEGPALAGAHVCLIDPEGPCFDSPITGVVDFCVPPNSRFAMSATLDGYMPFIGALTTGAAQSSSPRATILAMIPAADGCTAWGSAGYTCPTLDKALVWIKTVPPNDTQPGFPPLGGVAITSPTAIDVFYGNPLEDPALTATDPSWGNAYAVFDHDHTARITLSRQSETCRPFLLHAWPGTAAQTIDVPVRVGFRTFVAVTCQ